MRMSSVTLVLLSGISASAFVPFTPPTTSNLNFLHSTHLSNTGDWHQRHGISTQLFAAAVKSPPIFPTPKVTSKTPISTDSSKMKSIMEARGCLLEIETAAEMARDYLDYLEQVAAVIRSFLQGQSLKLPEQPNLGAFPDLHNVQEAQEYLANIEKATSSASDYLDYLETMASGIKLYLNKFQKQYNAGGVTSKSAAQAQEAKIYMSDLDETSEAAHEYLEYLKTVTSIVQQYLVDPSLNGIQELLKVSPPVKREFMLQQDEMPELSARATRVIPKPKVQPDVSHNARPTYRIAGIPMTEVKSAKNASSSATSSSSSKAAATARKATTTPTAVKSATSSAATSTTTSPSSTTQIASSQPTAPTAVGGTSSYLNSMSSGASPTSRSTGSGTTSYLDSIAVSSYSSRKATNGSYLDSIASTTPPPRSRANGHLETPRPTKSLVPSRRPTRSLIPRPTISLSSDTSTKTTPKAIPDVDKKNLSSAAADGVIVGSDKTPKTAKVRVVPAGGGGGGGAVPNPVERSEVKQQQQQQQQQQSQQQHEPTTSKPAKPLQPLAREPISSRKSGTKGTLRFFMSRVSPQSQDPNIRPDS